jgi:hypothetical protein
MIRAAAPGDLPQLLEWGREFHAMSGMAAPFDPDAVSRLLLRMMESPDAVILMTERGGIGGFLMPAWTAPDWLIAVETFWFAGGDGRALLTAFESWAAQSGAREVRMTTLAAERRAEAVMSRRGYAAAEISWTRTTKWL